MKSEKRGKKCGLVFADWGEISDNVVSEMRKATKAVGLKFFKLETYGDWVALAICERNATKRDAEKAFEQRKNRKS